MDEQKALLREAFGDSSQSEKDDEENQPEESKDRVGRRRSIFGESLSWKRIREINGLWLCEDFLSPEQQSSLLSAIEKEGWLTDASHNQAMRFGDLPHWASELSDCIRDVAYLSDSVSESMYEEFLGKDEEACLLPSKLLWREPLFNQLIVNIYQPGEGICAHVDLMRFEDGIAIVSLESSCVMHFTPVESAFCEIGREKDSSLVKIPLYLTPGSLVIMWGEARYQWKHEINRKPGFQKWEGQDLDQRRRTSITLRKLCQTE